MSEKPIIFSTEMVQAILAGRKTQTMRVIKPKPSDDWMPYSYGDIHKMTDGEFVLRNDEPVVIGWGASNESGDEAYKSPYHVNDVLWVRETFKADYHNDGCYCYKADKDIEKYPNNLNAWCSPIYMHRKAARIFLRVTDIRAERLREITPDDVLREGFTNVGTETNALDVFSDYWHSLNAKRCYGWDTNPWVWVITFERIKIQNGAGRMADNETAQDGLQYAT